MKDPKDMPTMAFDRWDFAETAKSMYKEGGIPAGNQSEAAVLYAAPRTTRWEALEAALMKAYVWI